MNPTLMINPITKEYAVFQHRQTGDWIVSVKYQQQIMKESGFVVLCAISGAQAIHMILEGQWRLVGFKDHTRSVDEPLQRAIEFAEATVVALRRHAQSLPLEEELVSP